MEGTMAAANTASQDGRPRDGKHALDMRHRIRAIVSYSDGNQRRNSAYEAEGPGFSGYHHLSWVHLTLHRCTARARMVRKGIIDMTILWPTGAYGRSTPEVGGCSSRRVEAWYICVGGTGCRSAHVGGRCARKYRGQNEEFLHLRTPPASSVIFFFGVCFRGRAVNAIATRTDVEGRKDLPTPRAGRADPSISVMAFVGDTKKFTCNYPRPYSKRDN